MWKENSGERGIVTFFSPLLKFIYLLEIESMSRRAKGREGEPQANSSLSRVHCAV